MKIAVMGTGGMGDTREVFWWQLKKMYRLLLEGNI